MAMDEEIIKQLIYIILGIIIFVIYSSNKAKKASKAMQKKSIPENKSQTTENSKVPKSIKVEDTESTENEIASLETIVEEEVFDDETTVDRKTLKHKVKSQQKDIPEKSFEISTDDLRKAVILSEIINPKYF
jgi:hypothetical protein